MNLLWSPPTTAVGQHSQCHCCVCEGFYSTLGSVPSHQPEDQGCAASFLTDTFKSMWSEYHQKHLVLIFWHKHVLSLVLVEVLDTFPSGRGAPEGAKMQQCQMLRFWNKETIWSHGLRTKRGYGPPPLLMHHLGTKHYGPGWALSCWGIAVLMQYRMQSFINQSIYGKKRFNQSKTYRDRWVKRVS